MPQAIKYGQPCPCGVSSDAFVIYDNGWGHCFRGDCKTPNIRIGESDLEDSVETRTATKGKNYELSEIASFDVRGNPDRKLLKVVAEFYGIKAVMASDGTVSHFCYPFSASGSTEVTGYKLKNTKEKTDQRTIGDPKTIFGLEHFRNGGRRIIITEGEEDTWAINSANYIKYKRLFPVVSMGSSQQTGYLLKERDTLLRFDEIILWFDNDESGKKAVESAAKIIGYDRVKVVYSDLKDANDVWRSESEMSKAADKIAGLIRNAAPFNPSGVVQGEKTWEAYKSYKSLEFVPWPPFLSELNRLTHGRALGSITMIAAGTSVGKSSLLREDIYHILKTTDAKIGACFLEEGVGETTAAIMGLHMNKRLGLPGVETTEQEEREAWEATLGTGRVLLVDHQGSVSDNSLVDKLEYLAAAGCQYIYLDHITIAVSETDDNNINANIDKFMNRLLQLVQRYNVWFGVVSHLRKVKSGEESFESGARVFEDDLKGSGSLKQVSFQTIALSRNKMAENEKKRHETTVWLLKDRKTGNTGPAGRYRFDYKTGRLLEVDPDAKDLIDKDAAIEVIGA